MFTNFSFDKLILLIYILLISTLSHSQTENYIDYYNAEDLLFDEINVTTITAFPKTCSENNCGKTKSPVPKLDYITGHTATVQQTNSLVDQSIIISLVYKDSKECKNIENIEQFILDVAVPDDLGINYPFVFNTETLHSLKIDNDLNLIGCGNYSNYISCDAGPAQTVIPVSWPFYFKYNICNGELKWIHRLSSDQVACPFSEDLMPADGSALDIEVLNDEEYIISLVVNDETAPVGREGSLVKINSSDGSIITSKKYFYESSEPISFEDIEIVDNTILGVGAYTQNQKRVPSLAIIDSDLNIDLLRAYYLNSASLPFPIWEKRVLPSAIKFNPETQSALIAAYNDPSTSSIYAINIKDFTSGNPDWMKKIEIPFPGPKITTTYGIEYLRNLDRFMIHAYGDTLLSILPMGLSNESKAIQYLVDIEDTNGNIVSINKLNGYFDINDHNIPLINNTLVQSYRTDELGLTLQNNLGNPQSVTHLFMTEKHSVNPNLSTECTQSKTYNTEDLVDSEIIESNSSLQTLVLEALPSSLALIGPVIQEICLSNQNSKNVLSIEAFSNSSMSSRTKTFPNPNMGRFTIQIDKNFDLKNSKIQVYDILQNVVYQKSEIESWNETIELPILPTGIYQLILSNKQQAITQKIVIH